jgi:hypothetical protein
MSMAITIPVRIKWWRRYKGVVIIPPRGDRRKELLKALFAGVGNHDMIELSGSEFYGKLKAVLWGEAVEFNVSLILYVWPIKDLGTELLFLLAGSDCDLCVMSMLRAINQYTTVKGTLTLYIPQAT